MRFDLYSCDESDRHRFTLGCAGESPLVAIGLNPSMANRERSDITVSKVERLAKLTGCDGFVMLNLYPLRATDFSSLPPGHEPAMFDRNLELIEHTLGEVRPRVLWAAWGNNVLQRDYLLDAALVLLRRFRNQPWHHFGPLTCAGHPRHPSRLSYDWRFERLDAATYRGKLKQWRVAHRSDTETLCTEERR